MVPFVIQTLPGRFQALGVALHFLARRPPFAGFTADQLVRTVDAQLVRGHARFAVEGKRVVGFLGWALYDREDALGFARTGVPPDDAKAMGRDVVWVLTAAATGPRVLLALIEELRRLYPGRRVMGVRHKPRGRRVVFDRILQPIPEA